MGSGTDGVLRGGGRTKTENGGLGTTAKRESERQYGGGDT